MIFDALEEAADNVGVNLFISDSSERIETQLNKLTRNEDLPIILISWDVSGSISFDPNGWITDPNYSVTSLLLTKPESLAKAEAKKSTQEMADLFFRFMQELNKIQRPKLRMNLPQGLNAVTNVTANFVPVHGAGKHSGILGTFNVFDRINVKCDE
jgi:hypothetical protein